ncbi:MAG: hypothetical protein SFW67_17475 [Myxococcaceae bacterium]|nr:hypothetical protein [Myxococcaceae bacterium]
MRLAWIARNQLVVQDASSAPRTIESQFAENARRKSAQTAQRNAWKTQNTGALFMGMGARDTNQLAVEVPCHLTGLTCQPSGELVYSLELQDVSGVFEVSRDGKDEKRLYHGTVGGLRDLARHPQASIAAAVTSNVRAGTSHVSLVGLDGEGVTVLTEGDAVERNPRWVPGQPRALVYESAGVGRTPDGAFAGLGPSSIVQLDAKTGELTTLAEAPGFDLCQPRVSADGTLYFVRRPWLGENKPPSLADFFLGVLLIPVRLVMAIAAFFNFFSLRYSGKPLLGGRNARANEADIRRMMLWGNMAQAQQQALADVTAEELKAVRAPPEWVLVRRAKGGTDEFIAKAVAAWDLLPDGSVLFTDGVDISTRAPDGRVTTIASDTGIRALVALPE